MSDIKIQFVYNGELRIGTVQVENRKGLVTLMTDKGYRSFKCDEISNLEYVG